MNGIGLGILIIFGLIGLFILWKIIKPYFKRHDTTELTTGGLGSGKTIDTVKDGIVLIRKQRLRYYYIGNPVIWLKNRFRQLANFIRSKHNAKWKKRYLKAIEKNKQRRARHIKQNKYWQLKPLRKYNKKPMLYSNIPIHFKKHLFGREREWSIKFTAPMFCLLEEIIEYSVVIIDELPQFVNQFNWNNELIQNNVNEFITFFRHYIGGFFLTNGQATDDIVCQVRRKLNIATWCFDFKKWGWPIPLFYTVRMCDIMMSDEINTMSTTFVEENTKIHFGLFPPKGTYDSRCYKPRYKNVYKKAENQERWEELTTSKILRLNRTNSPLDDTKTEQQKQEQWNKGEEIWKN